MCFIFLNIKNATVFSLSFSNQEKNPKNYQMGKSTLLCECYDVIFNRIFSSLFYSSSKTGPSGFSVAFHMYCKATFPKLILVSVAHILALIPYYI